MQTRHAAAFLNEFLRYPTCPATESGIDVAGPGIEARNSTSIEKRDILDSFPEYEGVLAWTHIMVGLSSFSTSMAWAWERSIGSKSLSYLEIRRLIEASAGDDPADVIEGFLCDMDDAPENLAEAEQVSVQLCEVAWNVSEPSAHDLEKRIFQSNLGMTVPKTTGSTRINTGALISRILDTSDVPFLYSRVIRYNNRYAGGREEIDLEGMQTSLSMERFGMFANLNFPQSSLTFATRATCKNALTSTYSLSSTSTLRKWIDAMMVNCMLRRTTHTFTTAKQFTTQISTILQTLVSGESTMPTEGECQGEQLPKPRVR